MPAWREFEQAEPDFANRVRKLFDAGRHKTLATLRSDGSPRISGIECQITDDQLSFCSMVGARKGSDLARDPRFALHGPTFHPGLGKESEWPGEAKITGRAIAGNPASTGNLAEETDGDLFIADITGSSSPGTTPMPPNSSSSRGRHGTDCDGWSATSKDPRLSAHITAR